MLFAICPTCLRECVRALFEYGRSSRTAVYSIFIENTFLSPQASFSGC